MLVSCPGCTALSSGVQQQQQLRLFVIFGWHFFAGACILYFREVARPNLFFSKLVCRAAAPYPSQIMINHENGHTGQLASITTMLNFFGASVRILTTIQEVSSRLVFRRV